MLGVQLTDILIIILVAVIIFAPMRLPQMVRGLKSMFSEFRKEVRQNDTAADSPKNKSKGR
ncbi:MAG: twin-arginine translocase TatA/TatE family subunit [Chloroflexi bacterium]|nr:twin-arginine translocase TatA/TatE family subunit [Chloroflexota bacterium]